MKKNKKEIKRHLPYSGWLFKDSKKDLLDQRYAKIVRCIQSCQTKEQLIMVKEWIMYIFGCSDGKIRNVHNCRLGILWSLLELMYMKKEELIKSGLWKSL